jgi:DNA-binding response OmpR family regulator
MEMRIIVFGRKRTMQKIVMALTEEGVEVVGIAEELDRMIALHKKNRFDLAIVDSLSQEAEAACQYMYGAWNMPLVLVVNGKQTDWQGLRLPIIFGYLPEEAKNGELAARLKVLLRRFWSSEQVERMSSCRGILESYQNLNAAFISN